MNQLVETLVSKCQFSVNLHNYATKADYKKIQQELIHLRFMQNLI